MDFALLAAAQSESGFLRDLVVILAAAGVVAMGATRLRLATVPAYLITGAIIGPGALALISTGENIEAMGHLAIVLLMFGIGLHFDLSVLRGGVGRMLGAAFGSIALTIAGVWPALHLIGVAWPQGLVLAMALSISSTAVVMRVYQQKRWMQRMSGRLSLAILVVQDLAVILMLILLPAIGRWAGIASGPVETGGQGTTHALVEALLNSLIALGGIAGLLLFGRYALPRILREGARSGSGEILMILSVAFAIGSAALTSVLGMSAELGAFLGGFLLSSTPFRHQLSGQIGTLRDLFLALFFTWLGTKLEFSTIAENWAGILAGTLIFMTLKTAIIGGGCYAIGATAGVSGKVGLSLAQGGEFGLVILSVAAGMSEGGGALVGDSLADVATAAIVISLIVTPMLIALGDRVGASPRLTKTAPWVHGGRMVDADQRKLCDERAEGRPHVIVAGFGVIGRAVCDRLSLTNATATVVEMNVETVRRQRQLGRSIVFGDVSDPEILENAGIHEAQALVLTIPDESAVLRACRTAKSMNPNVFIIARTNFLSRAMVAHNLGANETVVEEMATAEKMDALLVRVLEGMGRKKTAEQETGTS